MKGKLLFGALSIALAMSSCSTIQHTSTTAGVDARVYNLTVAELDVAEKKAKKTHDWKWNPFRSISLSREKTNVTASLLNDVDADVLVEPQFEVKRRGFMRGGSITVSGFPAKYKNFHSMTRDEAEIIAISNGTYPGECSNPCGVGPQIANKSAARNAKPVIPVSIFKRERLTLREATAGHTFLTAVGGILCPGDFNDGYQIGLMVGKHGKRWGKYAKVMVNHASYQGRYEDEGKTLGQITVGTIFRASGAVGIFGGIGVGKAFVKNDDYYNYSYGGDYIRSVFAVPVELGVQVNIGSRLNLIAGAGMPISGHSLYAMPTFGIGYTF